MSVWGSIDILNELRKLKHPHIGYYPSCNPEWDGGDFDDVFIRFQETGPNDRSTSDIEFVNAFIEDALTTGKRLSWGGDPDVNFHDPVRALSTYY